MLQCIIKRLKKTQISQHFLMYLLFYLRTAILYISSSEWETEIQADVQLPMTRST